MILPMLFHSLRALTDEQLMARVSGKDDERAYDELYRRHARRLMGFFFRQLGHDEALAADLTQDTFMRVWANRNTFYTERGSVSFYPSAKVPIKEKGSLPVSGRAGGEVSFSTWLYSIAYNLCKNHFRHISYEQEYAQEVALRGHESEDNTFDIQLDRQIFEEVLQSELAKLPPALRLLFSLRFEEDLSIPQIAVILGIPEGTVKSRIHRLVQMLRKNLIPLTP